MRIATFALTDIGLKRKVNQDAYLRDDELGLYIVADGMGGHKGGEVASWLAVEGIRDFYKKNKEMSGSEVLDKGINICCQEIYNQSLQHEELSGMGTTVLASLLQNDTLYIGQVGDSRAYLLTGGCIWQITEDHSLLNEEIRSGRISPGQVAGYQFKNVITRSVGYESTVVVDIYTRKVKVNDIYLLCTDGLSGLVGESEMLSEIQSGGLDAGVKKLVALANERGGDDNITALACHVLEL